MRGRPGRHPVPVALTRALLDERCVPAHLAFWLSQQEQLRGGTTYIWPDRFGHRCLGLPLSPGSVLESEAHAAQAWERLPGSCPLPASAHSSAGDGEWQKDLRPRILP